MSNKLISKKNIYKIVMLLSIIFITGCSKDNDSKQVYISAASSLKDVMIEIKEIYEDKYEDVELIINYGGSGSLKTQIENGAPCDIFISASDKEVNELIESDLVNEEYIKNIASNELVLVSKNNIEIKDAKKIAQGYPESVPVGMYTQQYLENENLYEDISDKIVYGKNVKEVLAWVKSENVDCGFVYKTDIVNDEELIVLENIDKSKHSKIVYPSVIINSTNVIDEVINLQNILISKQGKEILNKYGYKTNSL